MEKRLVDNETYNLISALASNLEAYEAYQKYRKDGQGQLWDQLLSNTEQAVQMLRKELQRKLMQSQQSGR
jgi:RNAse (barnase) inhibitor barstar